MQATAKRRLAQRRRGVFRAPATEVEPKQEGWLAPLEKKCPETQIWVEGFNLVAVKFAVFTFFWKIADYSFLETGGLTSK